MRRSDVWGWGLFVVCALVFLWAGVRDGDALMTVGSVLFLVACFVFLAPLAAARSAGRTGTTNGAPPEGDDTPERHHEQPV
jgi:hypothetical protein